jgi:hypothetical protein
MFATLVLSENKKYGKVPKDLQKFKECLIHNYTNICIAAFHSEGVECKPSNFMLKI